MDWGSLIGVTLLLTLVILVLRVLWRWLIILLLLGPPTWAGIVVGHFASELTHDVGVGLLIAILAAGLLSEVARGALRDGARFLGFSSLGRGT